LVSDIFLYSILPGRLLQPESEIIGIRRKAVQWRSQSDVSDWFLLGRTPSPPELTALLADAYYGRD